MTAITKKICLVGDFAVGKTSLVARFVKNVFNEKYITTVGVKIDTKQQQVGEHELKLVIWDIAGENAIAGTRASYLRGASGYLLVADGTRPDTLETAIDIKRQVDAIVGEVPFVGLLNKVDLTDLWDIPESQFDGLLARGWDFVKTSAMSGEGVEQAFERLGARLLEQ